MLRVLKARKETLAERHEFTYVIDYGGLASGWVMAGKFERAEEIAREAMEGKENPGVGHLMALETMHTLAWDSKV